MDNKVGVNMLEIYSELIDEIKYADDLGNATVFTMMLVAMICLGIILFPVFLLLLPVAYVLKR